MFLDQCYCSDIWRLHGTYVWSRHRPIWVPRFDTWRSTPYLWHSRIYYRLGSLYAEELGVDDCIHSEPTQRHICPTKLRYSQSDNPIDHSDLLESGRDQSRLWSVKFAIYLDVNTPGRVARNTHLFFSPDYSSNISAHENERL